MVEKILKRAVVTALFNSMNPTDQVGACTVVPGWDYIFFTYEDKEVTCPSPWRIVRLPHLYDSDVKMAKYVKWMTHKVLPEYDIILWHDVFLTINDASSSGLQTIVTEIESTSTHFPLALLTHPTSKDCYDEAHACFRSKKITADMRDATLQYLESHGHSREVGGYWSCMLLKQNKHALVQKISEELFDLIQKICYRDQVWISYLFELYKVTPAAMLTPTMFLKTGRVLNHKYVR